MVDVKTADMGIKTHKNMKSSTTIETEKYQIEDKIEQYQNKIVP